MDINKIIPLMILMLLSIAQAAHADKVYLKNGGSVEGIIEKDNADIVEIDMGFGTMTFNKSQIKSVKRSTREESYGIAKKWDQKRKELGSKEKEFDEAREKRFEDASKGWEEEIEAKKAKEGSETKNISIGRDESTKSIVVETVLNEKVKANLILDTGASIIALSRKIGEELGIDLSDTTKDVMELRLADGRKAMAKSVILDSVKIQDVEVKKVMAAIMLDETPVIGSRDGLLGMNFLSKFNLKTDLKSMKMSLEKIEK